MKIKKLAAILTASISMNAIASSLPEGHEKILAELGLPAPHSGIQIVPRALMPIPNEILKEGKKEESQLMSMGYINKETTRPQELMAYESSAKIKIDLYKDDLRPQSTHLRAKIDDLQLAFEYTPIPDSLVTQKIAFAPQGAYHENGWSGAVEFFKLKESVCAYAERNVLVSGTSAQLAMEDVKYTVNNKPTLSKVTGNKKDGFIYKINWFDDDAFHELECANQQYSKTLNDGFIKLANSIDKK